jgi:hypothetical protein
VIIVTAGLSVLIFIVAFWRLRIVDVGLHVLSVATGATAVLKDKNADDLVREKAMQKAAIDLFKSFFTILFRSALALALSLAPIWLADVAGLVSIDEVIIFMSRWDVLIVITLIVTAGYLVWKKLSPSK